MSASFMHDHGIPELCHDVLVGHECDGGLAVAEDDPVGACHVGHVDDVGLVLEALEDAFGGGVFGGDGDAFAEVVAGQVTHGDLCSLDDAFSLVMSRDGRIGPSHPY